MSGEQATIAHSPFHAGEREVQARVGVREVMDRRAGRAIRDFMPDQHREFFASLSFLPAAVSAGGNWPAATILAGPPGFIASPDPRRLRIAALPDPDDPARAGFVEGAPIGLLGIDLATRRRNRANGRIARIGSWGLEIAVEQSFGNCPQYIQRREIGAIERAEPTCERLGELDAAARELIGSTDTFFVASGSEAGMDMSHRGGRPGFVRVDADELTVPDFAGNRYFNTMGNFAINPRAALLFPDFATGGLLHVSGVVEIVWDSDEARRLRGAERLWRVHVREAWRRERALPLRWSLREPAPTTLATGTWQEGTWQEGTWQEGTWREG